MDSKRLIVKIFGMVKMNANWLRKIVSDEIRETMIFCGFVDNYHCKTKEKDNKGNTRYRLSTKIGDVLIYSPKTIYIAGEKFTSVSSMKYGLIKYL